MKTIIEFNLPEESDDLRLALHGSKAHGVLWSLMNPDNKEKEFINSTFVKLGDECVADVIVSIIVEEFINRRELDMRFYK
jgi:hypothetical protein